MSTIVLAAGGTGGHLFPAQALAAELTRRGRRIVVMTDARGTQYPTFFPGARIEIVPSATFSGGLSTLTAPFKILAGIAIGLSKLISLKPAAVVGFGGYPSLPVMLAAIFAGVPTAILAPDAVLGRANRLLANSVNVIAGGLPLARFLPKDMDKVTYTGNPVRPEVVAMKDAPYETPTADGPLNLLVFGGSQGARALSEIVPAAIAKLPPALKSRLSIVQQCRPEDIDAVRAAYAGVNVELASFFGDMPQRMAKAHLVIARSGVSTVSELAVIGRPAILIPYPFATDDHQTANANVLSEAGAAWTIQQRDLTAEKLAQILEQAFADPAALAQRASAAHAQGKPDAAARLADLVGTIGRAA
ncbi:MAG TPA: undecaprenyldiphospho-muramoylpentapeptide beta-N-acetylglucosaminyltransferase [Rhizomicrobium sp.]|jgi:UDP-N-acetylglucosamine--N-acetylmuramyl-(pentapeptide) pyrophosphoryl-undecaprenol N-acetylglucosamine transferase|nr:undecaprenyldiphospho-muramoylpentapeptide beta-N-acetylglucosaminyltransferase [Rhizomicrobium sp.]